MTSKEILSKIEASFRASLKGEESLTILVRWWGFIGYLFFYFIIEQTIKHVDIRIVDILLSSVGVAYFGWHIFALIKCSPKKPKLSKEEKKRLRAEKLRAVPKAFMRKLLLQEPITKWNTTHMMIAADILFCATFLSYLMK